MTDYACGNIRVLRQIAELLRRIDDQTYRRNFENLQVNSVGAHVRHNLDHYASFFAGLENGTVDYERRERPRVLEINRRAALNVIDCTCQRLATLTESHCSKNLRICCASEDETVRATSSVMRELDFLQSHTIHHHAIIAVMCRLQNVAVEQGFGLAPATLRYRATSKISLGDQ